MKSTANAAKPLNLYLRKKPTAAKKTNSGRKLGAEKKSHAECNIIKY
jgi:hypothetical protein